MQKLISIVIPTYRRTAHLQRALESIEFDDLSLIDVIVIDDDEEMSGATVVEKFGFVRYFSKRGQDRGLSHSRNLGILLASGKYIIFLDDDDFFLPNAISNFVRSIVPFKSFYYGNFVRILKEETQHISIESVADRKLMVSNEIPAGAFMIEKCSIKAPFDTSMKSHEDWNFLLINIDWDHAVFIQASIVAIDKTAVDSASMQNRRRAFFWMEFLSMYCRFPAPELAEQRSKRIAQYGVNIPAQALKLDDRF